MNNLKKTMEKVAIDFLEIAFIATSTIILTFLFLAQPLIVTGTSMLPTFLDQEQIVVEKITIKYRKPERGEIIIVKHPDNPKVFVIKRVIGIPDDNVKFANNALFVNGQEIDEPYVDKKNLQDELTSWEVNLKQGQYYVLGDNRRESSDSREWGPIEIDQIVGRVFLVYYPINSFRLVQQH